MVAVSVLGGDTSVGFLASSLSVLRSRNRDCRSRRQAIGVIAERPAPKFDRISNRPYNSAIVTTSDVLAEHFGARLAQKQLSSGGWPALRSSSQTAFEPTALACIALGPGFQDVHDHATACLARAQNANGSWPAFLGDGHEGAWVTSLALIALHDSAGAIPERVKGFFWLLNSAGEESNWLWKWKFRTADRHVRFDPDKFGWPWVPHTNSWVVPTAFSILALNQIPCACGLEAGPSRVERGMEMLLDRACPGGGWNAGNGVVYGVALAPHPDDTAIALLALSGQGQLPAVRTSIDWLERVAPALGAPWSLAWSILALAAHGRPVEFLLKSLWSLTDLENIEDNGTLAAVCLALNYQRALAAFGVAA